MYDVAVEQLDQHGRLHAKPLVLGPESYIRIGNIRIEIVADGLRLWPAVTTKEDDWQLHVCQRFPIVTVEWGTVRVGPARRAGRGVIMDNERVVALE